ncbi:hypothetical protein LRAMOSA07213 [Lichtheimia ramosa]|uniref:Receptor for retinol uptake STRA6 n=1 Tax=Lichtheimia ramosa TaxID=688394 RepID=A0A077WCC5_9FUNG|nr:hypothetical protein LRAMOSA07213 [Lichtheimia ramosa]
MSDDWVYYPEQAVNISMSEAVVHIVMAGGCCAPNRMKPTGRIYQDYGESFGDNGTKIVGIADAPLIQTIAVEGTYMRHLTDDHAMNLTLLASVNMADKQAVLYGAAFDRAGLITYKYMDAERRFLGNHSTDVLRNSVAIPDVTLPRHTRFIEISIYGSRTNPLCFTYIYAGLYVDRKQATITRICSKLTSTLQYTALGNFVLIPACFAVMAWTMSTFEFPPPVRFLCRQPTPIMTLCVFMMMGSFIFNQAWNLINSQSVIFDEWLPRAVKVIELFISFFLYAVYFYPVFLCYSASYRSRLANVLGVYVVLVLFSLRVVIDLPSYVVTYARDVQYLVFNVIAAVPAILAYAAVLGFFVVRSFTFRSCDTCRIISLEVTDTEEQYVRRLFVPHDFKIARTIKPTWWRRIWLLISRQQKLKRQRIFRMATVRWLFGTKEIVRIPLVVKVALTLLIYCLAQLIPILLTQMIGVGGVVPTHICAWSPYLAQFQYHPDPMHFAVKSFMLMQIAAYFATVGAVCMIYAFGILRRVTKDLVRLRRGDYGIFKGKKDNDIDIDDAIRFLGVCVGFGFTGTMYFMVEVALIGTGIAMLIQLDHVRDFLLHRVGYGTFFASFFVALVVQMIQKRITGILFLKNGSRFSLQNRAPFLHYWYFMMLTSMTRALTSYIIRTLKLALRYPIFSLRVDRNAETWSVRRGDGGFVGYCGMLLAEHEYNNPVLLVFIECLLPHIHPKRPYRYCNAHDPMKQQDDSIYESDKVILVSSSRHVKAIRARTRWFLAYTLIHNPMIRKCRKHVLKAVVDS